METGFIVDEPTKDAVVAGVENAMISRGLPVYWSTGAMEIFTGDHQGLWFIPFTDEMKTTNLRKGQTPMDFPETSQLLSLLGGLDARVDIDPADLVEPDAPTDP